MYVFSLGYHLAVVFYLRSDAQCASYDIQRVSDSVGVKDSN